MFRSKLEDASIKNHPSSEIPEPSSFTMKIQFLASTPQRAVRCANHLDCRNIAEMPVVIQRPVQVWFFWLVLTPEGQIFGSGRHALPDQFQLSLLPYNSFAENSKTFGVLRRETLIPNGSTKKADDTSSSSLCISASAFGIEGPT